MDEIEEDEHRDNHYNSKMTRLNCNQQTFLAGIICVQQQDKLTWTGV